MMGFNFLKPFAWVAFALASSANAHSHQHSVYKPYQPTTAIASMGSFNEQWQNRIIANWSLQQLNASTPQIFDPYVVERLYNLTASMNAQVRSQALLAVPIINDKQINAFAVTGGLIGINLGTIVSAQSQDEFASVLAHEIAHLSQRHYEHSKDAKNKLLAIQLGGLLAAIAASTLTGDGAAAAMIGSQALATETAAAHSREHEREADRVGMQILAGAGFDVRAMPRFFERLHRQSVMNVGDNAFIPSFVRSHPLTAERLSETAMRANTYPIKSSPDKHAKTFDLLKWRLKYLSKTTDLSELKTASKTSTGAKLALIAKLADLREFATARQLFAQFDATLRQSDPLFCITEGHIAYEQGDFEQAVKVLQECHHVYPERTDLQLYLADALVMAGWDMAAEKLLNPIVKANEHNVLAWDLLQKNYENRAKSRPATKALAEIHALRSRGKQELWTGSYDKALSSFATARGLADTAKQAGLVALLEKDSEQVRTYRDFKVK